MATDPYAAPRSRVADAPAEGGFIPGGRAVPAGNGWRWIVDGWGLFVRRPGMWILVVLVLYVISTVISWIPLLGAIALTLLSFVFAGGVMLGCAELDDGRPLELRHLFAGFGGHLGRLLLLGLLFLAAEIVLVLVAAGLGAAAIFGLTGGAAGDPDAMGQAVATVLVAVLVALALLIPILMLVWFTPALVALQELGVVDALKASFAGCLKNIVPFLLYGVVLLVLSIIAAIPLMLGFPRVLSAFAESQFKANLLVTLLLLPGWLVLSPTFVGSVYTAYRDIYYTR